MHGQNVNDPCFNSIPPSIGFSGSSSIANASNDGADMFKYVDGVWQGAEPNSSLNITISPPVNCDAVKAAFLRVQGEDGEGIGLKLDWNIINNQNYEFEVTYVSHGIGSDGTFAPQIYTTSTSQLLFDEDIIGYFIDDLPTANGSWTTQSIVFTGNELNAGHQWIWIWAEESSGMILNFCQTDLEPIEMELPVLHEACEGETIELGENINGANYNWSTGSTSPIITVSEGGFYAVAVSNACNVLDLNTWVQFYDEPGLNEEDDLDLCEGETFLLHPTGLNPTASWPDGSTDSTFTITTEGSYNVIIEDECGIVSKSIFVNYDSIPEFDLGPDTTLCQGQSVELDASSPFAEFYEWQDGSTSPLFNASEEGAYSATATNHCGSFSDIFNVDFSLKPVDIFPDVIEFCLGHRSDIDASHINGTYLWHNGATTSSVPPDYTGLYWVNITDDDGCFTISDTVLVKEGGCVCPVYIPNAFTPDNDGRNDVFECVFDCVPYDYEMKIYNQWGTVVHTIYFGGQGWDGEIAGEQAPTGVYHYRLVYRESYDGIPIEQEGHISLIR